MICCEVADQKACRPDYCPQDDTALVMFADHPTSSQSESFALTTFRKDDTALVISAGHLTISMSESFASTTFRKDDTVHVISADVNPTIGLAAESLR